MGDGVKERKNKTSTKNMKRYHELTQKEKLALKGDEIRQSIVLEAIDRGIKPPLDLGDMINKHGFTGFSIPSSTVRFFEITIPGQYGSPSGSGLAYKTEEEAKRALEGAICLYEDGYGSEKKNKVSNSPPSYAATFIGLDNSKYFSAKFEEYSQEANDVEYEKISKEIRAELDLLWQERYNVEVAQRKRSEYIKLADGNLEIAAAFWAKTERTDFPDEEAVVAPEPESVQ